MSLPRLVVCYVPAIDLRHVARGDYPQVAALLAACPVVRFFAQGSTDHMPTLLTGLAPHEHGLWGPRLKPTRPAPGRFRRMIDRLPDAITTTAQCAAHFATGRVDVATMPPRRRRRFDWRRLALRHSRHLQRDVCNVNGVSSIFNLIAPENGRFVFTSDHQKMDKVTQQCANGDRSLEWIDYHGLDYFLHWHLGDDTQVREYMRTTDDLIGAMLSKCQQRGIEFVLLSDHGQEVVDTVIDPLAGVADLDLSDRSFETFVEGTKVTFWFGDDETRSRIITHMSSLDAGQMLMRQDMERYGLKFDDGGFGDAFFYAKPGTSFFPNDFYQPIANAALAAFAPGQRPRLRQPWHRGDHGYLPGPACEQGFMVVASDRWRVFEEEGSLLDIAPTLLGLLDTPVAPAMRGRNVLRPRVH